MKSLAAIAGTGLAVVYFGLAAQLVYYRLEQGRPRTATSMGRAKEIRVKAGGDLQAAINAGSRGDTIIVDVAKFNTSTGFVLPAKPGSFDGSNYITIKGANASSLPSGRVSLADGANMPTLIVTQRGTPVITVDSGASGYQLIGLEIKNNLSGNTGSDITNTMVEIAYRAKNVVFDRLIVHPNEHPTKESNWLTRGKFAFSNNGSYVTLKNSYVYDFLGRDPQDSQSPNGSAQQTEAFYISPTTDHTVIDNNFLEAWYAIIQTAGSDGIPSSIQTVLSSPSPTLSSFRLSSVAGLEVGMMIAVDLPHSTDPNKCKNTQLGLSAPCWALGRVSAVNPTTGDVQVAPDLITVNQQGDRVIPHASPAVPGQAVWAGTQPQEITVTRNTLHLPIDFSAYHKATNGNGNKGVVETKACLNCLFEGNIINGYPGTLAFTTANQNGGCPWCTTANLTVRNNWFQTYREMVLLSLTDYGEFCTQGHDIVISNNLANSRDVNDGSCVRVSGAAKNVTIVHNTCTGGYPNGYTGLAFVASGPSNGGLTGGSAQVYQVDYPTGVVIRDNLIDSGKYTGICYRNVDRGAGSAFLGCFKNPSQDHNLFVLNVPDGDPLSSFPGRTNKVVRSWAAVRFAGSAPDRLSDWKLQAESPGHNAASDGTDIGVNIDVLSQMIFASSATSMPKPARVPSQ